MSQLQEKLDAGQFVVTGEIGPPKGTNVAPCLHEADEYLKGRVVAVNVTDIQTAVMRLGSMAVCHMLIDHGIGPWKETGEFQCQSGLDVAYIGAEGNLYPCPGLIFEDFVVGNVFETPVSELLRSEALSKVRRMTRTDLEEPCRSCENEACSGGCRGAAFATFGDIRAAPTYCNWRRRMT